MLSFSVDKEFVIRVEVDQHAVLLLKSESEERIKLFLKPHITVELVYLSKHFIICIRLTSRLFLPLRFALALSSCILAKLVQLFVPEELIDDMN